MAVVTRQRWWRLSQGSDGGGCHTDDVKDVVSHWTSAVDSSLWLPQYPELTRSPTEFFIILFITRELEVHTVIHHKIQI